MPVNNRDIVDARRAQVASLYLTGHLQSEIATMVGVTQQQVSQDLKKIREEWKTDSVRDFDAAKAEELARIDALEAEYWSAWRASRQPKKSRRTTQRAAGKGGAEAKPQLVEQIGTVQERDGDPRYLTGVRDCIESRIKLLGLAAPKKLEHSGPDGSPLVPATPKTDLSGLSVADLEMLVLLRQKIDGLPPAQ